MVGPFSSLRVCRGVVVPVVLLSFSVIAGAAAAADEFEVSKYGARLGFSSNPDQFTVGGYAQLGELAPKLSMRPSMDLGWGDDVFSWLTNLDLQYSFAGTSVVPFVGAGLGIAYYNFSEPEGYTGDSSDTSVGLGVYGGAEMDLGDYKSGYIEARFGVDEMPDFKLTLGFGFY